VITWVIGSGGLLGSAVARHCGDRYEPGPVPWADPEQAREILHNQARGFEKWAGDQPWRVIWAAGSATTSTPRDEAMSELEPLTGVLTGLRSALPSGPGVFFLTSSAGGVYAGSTHPPFSTQTAPVPLSAYGELKLAQEAMAIDLLGHLVPVVIGRISNLYGPGQNLDKLQGLISHLAMAAVTRQPVNIFVPLDTTRDYIFVNDAAEAILALTHAHRDIHSRTEIIATGRGTTIGQLVRTMNEIAKRKVPVALGMHASASAQAVDLRLTPTSELCVLTPLPVGVKAVHSAILSRIQQEVPGR